MAKFSDNWATSHRNWQAIFAAVSLAALLVWALSLKHQDESRTLLRTDQVMATVTNVKVIEREGTNRFGQFKNTYYVVQLKLNEEKLIQFLLLQPAPQIGSQVPVMVDFYNDGQHFYHYNLIDWQLTQ